MTIRATNITKAITLSTVLSATLVASTALPLLAQHELPPELTVTELSDQAYRRGLAEKNLIVRRAVEKLENERPAEAAVFFRRAALQMRKEIDVAASDEMVRDLRLAANDLVWLADELAGGRAPHSEELLATVAMASHTLARHHRDTARQAFSDRYFDRAGDHLEAAAVNTDAALAYGGISAKVDASSLEEARQVATRLATGGRGGKLRDRFGTAVNGLSLAISRAEAEAVWPMRRAVGRLVDHDLAAGTVVIESPDSSGPDYRFAAGAVVIGKNGIMSHEALDDATEVAVWYRSATPTIAARVVIDQ